MKTATDKQPLRQSVDGRRPPADSVCARTREGTRPLYEACTRLMSLTSLMSSYEQLIGTAQSYKALTLDRYTAVILSAFQVLVRFSGTLRCFP